MGRIRIIDLPGDSEPEWVRRAWLGRELDTNGEEKRWSLRPQHFCRGATLPPIVVTAAQAIHRLNFHQPSAADWYKSHYPAIVTSGSIFSFDAKICHPLVSGMDLDPRLLQDRGLRIALYRDGDDNELLTELTAKLGVSPEKAEALFQELRVFLVGAMICAQEGMSIPGREIFQPPPQLEAVYKALSQCSRYLAFLAFSHLPDFLAYQAEYPAERRINESGAAYIYDTAKLCGLPLNPSLWQF